jgi:hypothetical protein
MPRKSGTSIRTKRYDRFRGVDFSTDPALVDDARSPWAPNMVADKGGMPEKRPGWRTLVQLEGRVNGLFHGEFDDAKHLLAHVGTKLLRWYEDGTDCVELADGLPDERSTAVFMNGYLWLFTGAGLLRYDGKTAEDAAKYAYVPTTLISRNPEGGGDAYEGINLLSGKQRVGFLADGKSAVYKLPYESVDSVDKVEVDGDELKTGFTAQPDAGTVTFTTAPAAPAAGAEDTVFITFTKTVEGYTDRIGKCRTAVVWGVGGASDRIIASGNPEFPNQDFTCGFNDGAYWPDTGYAVVGSDETAIVGYRRMGEYLAIIKEDNGQDSTVFLRGGDLDEDGEARFWVKPCLSGAGAVSRFGFGNIGDEQLILTGGGVYALITNSLTAERIVQNRSWYVDPKLTTEQLSQAVSCSFDSSYLVFVGGHVYGLDGRQQRSYPSRNDTTFLYECFYWENVPARCVMVVKGQGKESLFFGTEDGRVCRFNTDIDGMSRYSDDGVAITAAWATRADDDGDPMVLKTLLKKGNAVTIKPYTRSSAQVLFRTERDVVGWPVASGTMDIFDWADIDFSRFTFNANDGPAEIPFNRKVKNYKRLQIIIKNEAVNEGFGVYAIIKHFVTGNFAKR